jgi:hypothetical protein
MPYAGMDVCFNCGGTVETLVVEGRTMKYRRGKTVRVPSDLGIPTCVRCGESYVDVATARAIDAVAKAQGLD